MKNKLEDIEFVAVDFETATNSRMICQIGLAIVRHGHIIERHEYLIQPPHNKYDASCTAVHHITPDHTASSPTFADMWDNIKPLFCSGVVVAHNSSFDHSALITNLEYYNLPTYGLVDFDCTYKIYGKKLEDLCQEFHIPAEAHHDALFDATCCARFYLAHLLNLTPEQFCDAEASAAAQFAPKYHSNICGDVLVKDLTGADPSNPFYDKKVVITGIFPMDRTEIAMRLKSLGADVDKGITKRTAFVVVGDEAGPLKLKKIAEYNDNGCNIVIVKWPELSEIFNKYLK